VSLKDHTCRVCGKISHNVDKDGRLTFPGHCPYCGTEAPYSTVSRPVIVVAIAVVMLVLVGVGWWARS
jgi:hypothetical protein